MNGTEQERLGHDDRFVIMQRLGAGATGVVYRALDRVRHHEVAIKFLKHVDGDTLYRFKNEFRALADLVHPNLVSLHELLSLGDEWYFTMDLIDGVPFDQFLGVTPVDSEETPTLATMTSSSGTAPEVSGQPLARPRVPMRQEGLERLWPTLEQLTQGVGALHRAGKLHRDIKPSNVLVTPGGRVVLCDFGLVAQVPGAGDPTVEYSRAGTPAYMSPEQAAGQPLSEATDWYSVGVMLYQVLTGRLPFAGDAATMRLRRTRAEPPSPRTCSGDMYAGVPRRAPPRVSPEASPTRRARPKSMRRASSSRPPGRKMLDGLTSRWSTPRACAHASASATRTPTASASRGSSAPRRSRSRRSLPSSHSMAR